MKLLSLTLLLSLAACLGTAPDPPLRVLLLGDSISIGYTPHVQEMMSGEAVVVRPVDAQGRPENCAGTTRGVVHLERWLELEGGTWDVIHFNFGLHDLKRVKADTGANSNDPTDPRQAEPRVYGEQLRAITERLLSTGAAVVFATTTPVPEGGVRPHRDPADVVRYNEIAEGVMAEHGIALDDLHAFAAARLAEIQRPGDVHFTPAGSRLLAGEVVRSIRAAARSLR